MEHHSLFSDKSDLYKQARPEYPNALFEYLSSLCPSNTLAWDSACGSGQATVGLAKHFKQVIATDISAPQLGNAIAQTNVQYRQALSECSGLEDHSVDLVCVAQALHWFDYDQFWPEVERVIKPDGVFTAFGYNFPSIDQSLDLLFEQQIMAEIQPYWASQNQLIWNHYRNVEIPFPAIDTPTFNMQMHWNLDEYFAFIHTFSATRRCMQAQGSGFFESAYEQAKALWGNTQQSKKVTFDFVLYVGRKRV